jgi:tetratricopeptide (TPR) repeat protein
VAIDLNNLAQLLKATNRLSEAEPLMRRALGIDEASYGKDHPDVAIDLNNLAQLLKATNRLSEAEPLMRRALEIFLLCSRKTGHEHPHLRAVVMNYINLLVAMELPPPDRIEKLNSLGPEPLTILRENLGASALGPLSEAFHASSTTQP